MKLIRDFLFADHHNTALLTLQGLIKCRALMALTSLGQVALQRRVCLPGWICTVSTLTWREDPKSQHFASFLIRSFSTFFVNGCCMISTQFLAAVQLSVP